MKVKERSNKKKSVQGVKRKQKSSGKKRQSSSNKSIKLKHYNNLSVREIEQSRTCEVSKPILNTNIHCNRNRSKKCNRSSNNQTQFKRTRSIVCDKKRETSKLKK